MELGEKMKELNVTADEIDRLTTAFKDETFRGMLRDYAQELADPENKKRYEEEIKLLEQERGNSIEFIHPEPFRALRTTVDGKQKCFINICSNGKVGKAECKCGVSEEGRRGQYWSLPHSLHPGRQDRDTKGNKVVIYDVIFHPDTLHIASKNKRFMDMVDSTAIQGIQNVFNVTLDKNNVREMNTKYKGTPQPCVIRKPIPGYKAKERSEIPNHLAFPYPDEKRATSSLQTQPTDSPVTKNSNDATLPSFQILPQKGTEPTQPNYTIKYRSVVDLQDFRCSRDSARSPRPKEIVVTIDLPLLKTVTDTSLEVKEKSLLLVSKKPTYRLELPLAYPVDEDKGEAKFNKQSRQLTVTLPVPPSNEAYDFAVGPATTGPAQSGGDSEGVGGEIEERGCKRAEEEQGGVGEEKVKEGREAEDAALKPQAWVEKGHGEEGEQQMRKCQEGVEGEGTWRTQKRENEKEKAKSKGQHRKESVNDKIYKSGVVVEEEEEGNLKQEKETEDGKQTENQSILITSEHPCGTGEKGEVNLNSCLESLPKISVVQEESAKTEENVQGNVQLEADAACPCPIPDEASPTAAAAAAAAASPTPGHDTVKHMDEDDLPTEQVFQTPECDKPPLVFLRELDEDGNEKVISDHSTSAGFIFQNTLMYELD